MIIQKLTFINDNNQRSIKGCVTTHCVLKMTKKYHFLEQKLQRIENCETQNVSDFARFFEQIQLTN